MRNGGSCVFHSILFDQPADAARSGQGQEPSCFHDLNLDRVVNLMTIGRAEYELAQFCHVPLHDAASVRYRHEILHNLAPLPTSHGGDVYRQILAADLQSAALRSG